MIEAKTKEIESKTKGMEAKTKEIEAKSKEIEAKCLSKAEIKELITDDCSKNPCENAKRLTKHVPSQTRNRRAPKRRHMIAHPGRKARRAPNDQSIAYD